MATLETQYKNYLKDNPDSKFTFDEWKEWFASNIILPEIETVEEYFLSNIKNMLQFNNDALAIRFMEKYYHAKKEEDKENDEFAIKFANWLRKEDTQENAEKWFHYSDMDMLNAFKEENK